MQGRVADDDEGHRRGEGAQEGELEPEDEDKAHQAQPPGEGGGELVLVGQGQPPRRHAPKDDGRRVHQKAQDLDRRGALAQGFLLYGHEQEVEDHGPEVEAQDPVKEDVFQGQRHSFSPFTARSKASLNRAPPLRLWP